jgi:hypothetical protein
MLRDLPYGLSEPTPERQGLTWPGFFPCYQKGKRAHVYAYANEGGTAEVKSFVLCVVYKDERLFCLASLRKKDERQRPRVFLITEAWYIELLTSLHKSKSIV